jgi:hypothetical protein
VAFNLSCLHGVLRIGVAAIGISGPIAHMRWAGMPTLRHFNPPREGRPVGQRRSLHPFSDPFYEHLEIVEMDDQAAGIKELCQRPARPPAIPPAPNFRDYRRFTLDRYLTVCYRTAFSITGGPHDPPNLALLASPFFHANLLTNLPHLLSENSETVRNGTSSKITVRNQPPTPVSPWCNPPVIVTRRRKTKPNAQRAGNLRAVGGRGCLGYSANAREECQ